MAIAGVLDDYHLAKLVIVPQAPAYALLLFCLRNPKCCPIRAEGAIASSEYGSINLKSYTAHGEVNLPLEAWVQQVLTLGAEWNRSELDDPVSTTQSLGFGTIPGYATGARSSQSSATSSSLFVEDNLEVGPGTILTPGLLSDHHDEFGNSWSPSLNLSQELTDDLTLKAGIARAFKAPNLYQLNPDYLISSRGNGCPIGRSVSCYLIGNADLRPEASVNKELGLQASSAPTKASHA